MTGLALATFALSASVGGYMTLTSGSTSRTDLDRCEIKLATLYDNCKGAGHPPSACNRAATTRLCGLSWAEDYGAYIDRRIEESATDHANRIYFVSLVKQRGSK